ncbi:AmmeMemoRadiSam system protein B [Myxococcota bacterium]|nr:AmmeMemoRadiSam system protein B [Myxococcota bacterium]MBU1410623.1 AmmeMemoRadiSam system protein B [Myxococcota bacterium]MBU1511228.1 AmmeMemoRadiSam system protein B [Myxococcota bacterium]
MHSVRRPVVAGRFYPSSAGALEREVKNYLSLAHTLAEQPVAALCPHAGIQYSGGTAGRLMGALPTIPDTVILLGPNHTGLGLPVAVDSHDAWETPLGTVAVHTPLRDRLISLGPEWIAADAEAHRREHSLEVQLPFLQCRRNDFRILPICLGFHEYAPAVELAHLLVQAADEICGSNYIIIASTDMSHFHPQETALRLDHEALEPFLEMNPEKAWDTVVSRDISMCGVIPAVCALSAALLAGATRARLIHYATSMEASGDASSVVGYASMVFSA